MVSGTTVESVKDAIAIGSNIIESAEKEVAWLVPCRVLVLTARYNLNRNSEMFIKRGGRVRGITKISSSDVDVVNDLVRIGEDIRHAEHYGGSSYMLVGDNTQSISSVQVPVEDLSLDSHIVAFWSEDPYYAAYLLKSFESAWTQGVDVKKHISALFKEGA